MVSPIQFIHSLLNLPGFWFQLAWVLFSFGLSLVAAKGIWTRIIKAFWGDRLRPGLSRWVKPALTYLIFTTISLVGAIFFIGIVDHAVILMDGLQLGFVLLCASYFYLFSRSFLLTMVVLIFVVSVGVLDKLNAIRPTFKFIDQYSFEIGTFAITPTYFFKAILTVLLVAWIALLLTNLAKNQIKSAPRLKSSTKELFSKISDISIFCIAVLISLNVLGIDLTTFAVLGGALGVGLGFGLQKITSNFISGIILLLEGSIEVGDLIEMGSDVYGIIRHLGARYTLIETFDGKEVLIPNEDFITGRVTNWTLSNTKGRIEINIGVSYGSDIRKARILMLEAAQSHPRCSKDPIPQCYLLEFGDSSVNFKLLLFVDDVTQGRWEVQSEVMMSVWDKFKANQIEIPFPQRDIHIRSGVLHHAPES